MATLWTLTQAWNQSWGGLISHFKSEMLGAPSHGGQPFMVQLKDSMVAVSMGTARLCRGLSMCVPQNVRWWWCAVTHEPRSALEHLASGKAVKQWVVGFFWKHIVVLLRPFSPIVVFSVNTYVMIGFWRKSVIKLSHIFQNQHVSHPKFQFDLLSKGVFTLVVHLRMYTVRYGGWLYANSWFEIRQYTQRRGRGNHFFPSEHDGQGSSS